MFTPGFWWDRVARSLVLQVFVEPQNLIDNLILQHT
jgi:hypothetical protein